MHLCYQCPPEASSLSSVWGGPDGCGHGSQELQTKLTPAELPLVVQAPSSSPWETSGSGAVLLLQGYRQEVDIFQLFW